jgi:PEP-CTERM motif/Bacterial protein of unknown function (DUF839)
MKLGFAGIVGSLLAGTALAGPLDNPTNKGPSSSQTPYLVPATGIARSAAILTTGDTVPLDGGPGTYRMVGIPDGLGALDNGNGTITVLMNHELGETAGIPRGHGGTGALVSKWTIDKNSLAVLNGRDLVTAPADFHVSGSTDLNRLCSADLPALSAFYDAASGLGYNGRIYMNGEEVAGGRSLAWVVAENAVHEVPKIGNFAHENEVASPYSGKTTLVIGNEDTAGGKLWVYVGTKTDSGSAIDKAGLTNGTGYAIAITGATGEDRLTNIGLSKSLPGEGAGKRFTLTPDIANGTGFLRPEDGAWDTKNHNRYYFVTTDQYDQTKDGVGSQIGRSRLWAITFDDVTDPTKGGKIELLLDGTEQQQMFDNITVDANGNVYLQEDVGNQTHNGKIWMYNPNTGALVQLFQHDPARFGDLTTPRTPPFNVDEESSGIIDVTDLFKDASWYSGGRIFLADVQAHYLISGELVEGGQLLLLQAVPEPGTTALIASGLLGLMFVGWRQRVRYPVRTAY